MAQKDWEEVLEIIELQAPGFFGDFLESDHTFLPNDLLSNPFNKINTNFSASDLSKGKPGSWIPVYKFNDISEYLRVNKIVPVRAGQAEFFFYKGNVFFDLDSTEFEKIETAQISPIESYVPATLKAKFQRNENAYLNKAIALGYINHFLDESGLSVFEHEIKTGNHKRLLYGQFGKIKITNPLNFNTTKGNRFINSGFQFEIDLVLENKDEIIIFEAKTADRPFKNFSLLQLYYPLIYLRSIIEEPKPIRTVFLDITTTKNIETYRLLEVHFKDDLFDQVEVFSASEYT